MAKKKKKKLHPKYKARRMVLILVLLVVAGVVCWRFLPFGVQQEGDDVEDVSQLPSEPEDMAEPEQMEEPEPEPEPEPAPAVRDDENWNLLLASAANPLPAGFEPPELETVTDGYRVDARIADSLRDMIAQARLDGISLMICSAYRAIDYQQGLFDDKVQEFLDDGADEEEAIATTATIIAVPGTSEHHTGLAVDIVTPDYQVLDDGFAETPAFRWLDQNAHKYGFILRYPQNKQEITKIIYEPWHYRYVGVEHATAMKESGYCLEEYLSAMVREEKMSEVSVAEYEGEETDDPQ